MPSRYYEKRERRQPDKTPLIDVIFLLLIFFFVTVVNLDVTPKPTLGAKPKGAQRKIDLIPMTNPMEPAPDSLDKAVLLQVQPANILDDLFFARVNELIEALGKQDIVENTKLQALAKDDLVIFVLDEQYSDLNAVKNMFNELWRILQKYKSNKTIELESQIKTMASYLPITLPAWNDNNFSTKYNDGIGLVKARLARYFDTPPARELHVRLHGDTYVKVIKDFFDLCNKDNIQLEHVKFRVIEQKSI